MNKFCNSSEDFRSHTMNHINNVIGLAKDLLDEIYKNDELVGFYNLNKYNKDFVYKVIGEGISLHDKAKLCTDEFFLEKNGLNKPFYDQLYKFYGRQANEELLSLIEKLNSIDQEFIDSYLLNFDDNIKTFFKKIEKFADCIERGCNPVSKEELGNPELKKASEFLSNEISKEELDLITKIEASYSSKYSYKF